jgi:hypothetical protein
VKGAFPLVGRTETSASDSQRIAFVVVWQNDASGNLGCCTAWSGQLQTDASGKESIVATWLLTGDAPASDDWKATTVGQDTFHRGVPPSASERSRRASSHPTKAFGSER